GKAVVAQHGGCGVRVAVLRWPRGRAAAALAATQGTGRTAAAARRGWPGRVAAVAGGGGPRSAGAGGRVDAGYRAGGGRRPGPAARLERSLLCARPGARTTRPALPPPRISEFERNHSAEKNPPACITQHAGLDSPTCIIQHAGVDLPASRSMLRRTLLPALCSMLELGVSLPES
ncbi:mCG144474, partial [Mus musculus]